MFGRGYKLFSVSDISIRIDLSWIIIALLVTWSLAVGLFPSQVAGMSPLTYWLMGAAGAIGLFLSVILHELSHAMTARRFGVPIRGITLFIFGGVAEMQEEPRSPRAEFVIAAAGPIMSIAIAVVCFGVQAIGAAADWPTPITAIFWYLAVVNILLVAFNLVPGFPLDGGRLLRAGLWRWKGNLRDATRIASRIGAGFGTAMIVLGGALFLLTTAWFSGLWLALIGLFLRGAAQASYRQLVIRQSLEGMPVRQFMNSNPVTVTPDTPVDQLVEDYLYKHHFRMLPIVDDGRLVGCVSMQQIKSVPREQWSQITVGSISGTCDRYTTVSPDTDAMKVLSLMNRSGTSRVMVAEGDRLVGIITLRDLMRFLAIKMELEQGEGEPVSANELPPQ